MWESDEGGRTLWQRLAACFVEDGEGMFSRVLELILEASGSPRGFFGYVDAEGALVLPALTEGIFSDPPRPHPTFPRGAWRGLWGRCLRDGETLYTNEGRSSPEGRLQLERAIASPISFNGASIGLLLVADAPEGYGEAEARQLEGICGYIAPILRAWLTCEAQRANERAAAGRLEREVKARTRALEGALSEIRVAHERLSILAHNINLGVLVEDEHGHVISVNQRLCDLLGIEEAPQALIGEACLRLAALARGALEQPTAFLQRCAEIVKARAPVAGERVALKGGRVLERDYAPIFSEEGYRGHIWHYREITDRVRAEALALRAAKMDMATTLAGGIAHDFNNLLTVLLGDLDLLELEAQEINAEAMRPLLEESREAINQARSLADQLLAYARGGRYHPQTLDLNAQVERALHLHERLLPSNVQLRLDLEPTMLCLEADPAQLTQLIANLCQNAVEAMPRGGALRVETRALELEAGDPRVVAAGLAPGPALELRVIDEGEGVAEAHQRRVFEPFFSTKGRGRGLGLAAVFGITSAHRGHVALEAREGGGTRVTVTLPARQGTATPAPMKIFNLGGDETILVVDDEPGIREVSRRLLSHYGYTVLLAADGKEAVEVVRDNLVDLTILDLFMPKLSGVEAFPSLQALRPQMPILLCSGYERDAEARALLEQGAVGFIHKPFEAKALVRAIRKVFLDVRA